MKLLLALLASFFVLTGLAAEGPCTSENGDANADGRLDLSDGITMLGHLFLGRPSVLPPVCTGISPIPATGQSRCYDVEGNEIPCDDPMCPGQNGFYQTGCPPEGRFVDHGDGTVSDTCTGLMWQKDTADTNGDGRVDDDDWLLWCSAGSYFDDSILAGYDDWRLPNVRELGSLVDFARPKPLIDPVFPTERRLYWSSTGGGYPAWFVHFAFGVTANEIKAIGGGYHVRGVRRGDGCSPETGDVNADGAVDLTDAVVFLNHLFLGAPRELRPLCASLLPDTAQMTCYHGNIEVSCEETTCRQDGFYETGCPIEGRFVDNGDGTVTDNCTGLMWQKDTDLNGDGQLVFRDDSLKWCESLSYCEDLTLAGYDDWRLPNVHELQSIMVDFGVSVGRSVLDPAFGNLSYQGGWSSTSLADVPTAAWGVSFGAVIGTSKRALNAVRAVRGGTRFR